MYSRLTTNHCQNWSTFYWTNCFNEGGNSTSVATFSLKIQIKNSQKIQIKNEGNTCMLKDVS